MNVYSFLSFVLLLLNAQLVQASTIGFQDILLDADTKRPLQTALWYPAENQGTPVTVGENKLFYGVTVIKDAKPCMGKHPLVVLSHGYRGNWRNLNWLAGELVQQGYIVAAPNHPGTTTFNTDPVQAAALWERPHDLSRVIDILSETPSLAGEIDSNRIAAIGHSLGGWTVTALAGGRFDTFRFAKECQTTPALRACSHAEELGLGLPELEGEMADPRVKAFVSLDLGLAQGFSPESLAGISVPALVIGAGISIDGLPASMESGYLAQELPQTSTTYLEVPGAMHFSFIQLCKPGAVALLEEETPGDGIVCKDGYMHSRDDLHRTIAEAIAVFLAQAFSQ